MMQKNTSLRRQQKIFAVLLATGLMGPSFPARAQTETPMRLTLAQAIDLALKQNRALKLARLAIEESESKKEIARAAYFPQIRNESSILHVTEVAGVVIPPGSFGVVPSVGPIPPKSLFIGQGSLTGYTSGTQLAQPLTQNLKIHEANRAAAADVKMARVQVDEAEEDIALKVRQTYFDLLIAQLKLEAAHDEVAAGQVKDDESANAVAQGLSLEVVALQSRASLLDARQSALSESLQIHDLTLTLDDLLGLPLTTQVDLDPDLNATFISFPSREDCIRTALEHSPAIRTAQEQMTKAKAGLGVARDAYIPDVTALARYSYQSGVPLLVHNFGTFGVTMSYDLFDGGKRTAQIRDARAVVAQAQVNLDKAQNEVKIRVETAYDKVEQLEDMVRVAQQASKVRTEAARLADRQFEQDASLTSVRADAHAKAILAEASLLEATLGLSLAQGDLIRTTGQVPR
jgi:outer membrane protein TolC